ncbi:MAG: GNAT family N-acetyltransferase [Sphingomonadales bacterium]|nr:GNAT family N-acetyltransferase [Sphingomonadales bacterium]
MGRDPEVMRWLGALQSRAESDAMIDRCIACDEEHGHCFWALERKSDGALLGFCGIKRVKDDGIEPDPGTPEIGWRLRSDAWGKGYAKEAAVASMDYAFDRTGADFVTAFTVPGNSASWGLMERLGMTRRADLDYWNPEWSPKLGKGIVYRITPAEWTRKRKELD